MEAGSGSVEFLDSAPWQASLVRAMRPHQWVKNVLIFLPVIAAHVLSFGILFNAVTAFVAYSLAASAIYLGNDLLDIEADRRHERKKSRPFAAGQVPVSIGVVASLLLTLLSLLVGSIVSVFFVGVLCLYLISTTAYSFWLKRLRWVDVFMLAWLYTLRVLAGSIAISVAVSGWLTVFVFGVFLSLGAVKRITELARTHTDGTLPGRGYSRVDIPDLVNIAGTGAFAAVAVFVAYTFSATADQLYAAPMILMLAAIPLAAWLVRMIVLARAGKQNYDPVIFALTDKIGLVLVALGFAALVVAI